MDGRYEHVVFMQGDDAREPLDILDEKGTAAAIDYLKQWHYGEGERSDKLGHGTGDRVAKRTGYILSWNSRMDYIGLDYDTKYKHRKRKHKAKRVY